jgi:hypothetical protein
MRVLHSAAAHAPPTRHQGRYVLHARNICDIMQSTDCCAVRYRVVVDVRRLVSYVRRRGPRKSFDKNSYIHWTTLLLAVRTERRTICAFEIVYQRNVRQHNMCYFLYPYEIDLRTCERAWVSLKPETPWNIRPTHSNGSQSIYSGKKCNK